MGFDLETWKARVAADLRTWRPQDEGGAEPAYAYLAAVTLWPVVEACRAADKTTLPTLRAAGGMRLVSSIMDWADAIDGVHQPASVMTAEPHLRTDVDAVLAVIGIQ
jgi:hypothetical protein